MSPSVEFPRGAKDTADTYREEYPEHICPDDDARLLTVQFTSDAPDWLIEQARRDAADARGEREEGAGQVGLSDHERDEIDFSKANASVPHARAVKGIAASEGVDDWLAHYDPTLTVDEHREVMERAAREGGGRRLDNEDGAAEKAGEAARTAKSEECDHAAGHCKHGDPEACELIEEQCGMDPDEILRRREPERPDPEKPDPEGEDITGEAAGALQRSWGGYQAAVSQLADALETVRETWEDAQRAAKAINEIRRKHGQDLLHFDKLEAAQADQMDILRHMAADCAECHADHSGHDHAVDVSPVEDIRVTVTDSPAETPVGISDDTREAAQEAAADLQADNGDADTNQFAQEQQGTLNVGVNADDVAEEKQVTLTGADATEANQAVPKAWNRINSGRVTRWVAGPYEIEAKPDDGRVVLWGPDGLSYSVGTGLPADAVAPIAEQFAATVSPQDVDFSKSDGTLDNAAAQAKKDALDDTTGLQQYA